MITGDYCTNIFSEQAKELIEFYRQMLEIPFIKTDDDNSNGSYLGFIENYPLFVYGIAEDVTYSRLGINPMSFKQKLLI